MNYSYKDFLLIKSIQSHPLRNFNYIEGSSCKSNLPLYLNKEAAKFRNETNINAIDLIKTQSIKQPIKSTLYQYIPKQQPKLDNKLQYFQNEESNDQDDLLIKKGNLQLRKQQERESPMKSTDILKSKLKNKLNNELIDQMSKSFRLKKLSNFIKDNLQLDSDYVQERSCINQEELNLFEIKKLVRKPSFFQHASSKNDLQEDLQIIQDLEKDYDLNILSALELNDVNVKFKPIDDEQCLITNKSKDDTQNPISINKNKYKDKDRQLLMQIEKLSAATDLFEKKKQIAIKQRQEEQKKAFESLQQQIIDFRKRKLQLSSEGSQKLQKKRIFQLDNYTTRGGTASMWSPNTSARNKIKSSISLHRPCRSTQQKDTQEIVNKDLKQVQQFNKMCQSTSDKLTKEKKRYERKIKQIKKKQDRAYNNIKYQSPPALYQMSQEYYHNQQKKTFKKKLINSMINQLDPQDQHMLAANIKER